MSRSQGQARYGLVRRRGTHPGSPRRVPSGGLSRRGAIPPRNWKSASLMMRPEAGCSSSGVADRRSRRRAGVHIRAGTLG
jgi:hypothetical protein